MLIKYLESRVSSAHRVYLCVLYESDKEKPATFSFQSIK